MEVASKTVFSPLRPIWVIVLLAFVGLLPVSACAGAPSYAPEAPSPSSFATGEPSVTAQLPEPLEPPGHTSAAALPGAPLPAPEPEAPQPAPAPVPDSRWQVEQSKLVTANAFWRR